MPPETQGDEMEIICYVEPLEETTVRYNADRSQYMTPDFRWHNAEIARAEASVNKRIAAWKMGRIHEAALTENEQHNAGSVKPLHTHSYIESVNAGKLTLPWQHGESKPERRCQCGNVIPPTGRRGRPATKCDKCRGK